MVIFVIGVNGEKLMPTTNIKKVRKLLKSGRAVIIKYDPFTIKLTYETGNGVQSIECRIDSGYEYIGVSIASEKHEYESAEYKLLPDEKEKHDEQRKIRRARRNRKRYRKPGYKSHQSEGWLAPSIKNKKDRHIDIAKKYYDVCPVSRIVVEIGEFDIQVLQALNEGKPVPEGLDYQHGLKYGEDTLRAAVFKRDNYTCIICKAANVPLHAHHLLFWKGDHTNRSSGLGTVCCNCHTPSNHQKGGALWGLGPLDTYAEAAFMNTVRWYIYNELKELDTEISLTYGTVTSRTRKDLNIEKTHVNDAYCIGSFRPKHRCRTSYYEKRRRNNRCLEKFYDVKIIDVRDGSVSTGKDLSCNKTNRIESRRTDKSLRIYRGEKIKKGYRSIRTQRYSFKAGDLVVYEGKVYRCGGQHNKGTRVMLKNYQGGKQKSVAIEKVTPYRYSGGWKKLTENEVKQKGVRSTRS